MPLELLSYSNVYYEDWLDLVALSSVEVDEDIYIWNEKPLESPDSQHFLFKQNQKLIASVLVKPLDENQLIISHWAIRGQALKEKFVEILKLLIARVQKNIVIWTCSDQAKNLLNLESSISEIDEKVSFFSNGAEILDKEVYGFCDHIYSECSNKNFQSVKTLLPIVNKEIMKPRYWKCFKISLI